MDYPAHFRPVIEQQGELFAWAHGTGTGASTGSATGIFREPFQGAVLGAGITVDASAPSLVVMSADIPNLARGDTCTVRGTGYTVRVPRANRVTGITALELEEP
jgi:hypothetical protein